MIRLVRVGAEQAALWKTARLTALADTPWAFGSTLAREQAFTDQQWLERAARMTSSDSTGYLAVDGENVCGIIAAFLDPDSPEQANLVSMWVAERYRRQGVGALLVDAVLKWAAAAGLKRVQLMVTSRNTSAERFYEQLGFSRTGRTEPYPNDPGMIEHEMTRDL